MPAETILVTGANGYIALHIIKQALAKGWRVIGTVRSERSAAKVLSAFPDVGDDLVLVQVPELTDAGAFEAALSGRDITAIINAASPLVHGTENQKTDVLDPAIDSARAVLLAARLYGGPELRRIVHISSFVAVLDLSKGDAPGKIYTPGDWNPITYDEAAERPAAGGERFLVANRCHWQLIRDAARDISNELNRRIDPGVPGAGEAAEATTYDVDGSKAEDVLGLTYTPLRVALKEAYEQLLSAEAKLKAGS